MRAVTILAILALLCTTTFASATNEDTDAKLLLNTVDGKYEHIELLGNKTLFDDDELIKIILASIDKEDLIALERYLEENPEFPGGCTICKLFAKLIQSLIKKHISKDTVEHEVDKLCNKLPFNAIRNFCKKHLAPEIGTLYDKLINSSTQKACQFIGYC
ncbi:unnamed protein product [Diabrotica balteata]|uniref:Saposin B-type domain-containing protein n=1 Tax=Diabrotica balteata TaxID=107213 RepID=A0A9P0DWZ2_DIABA|nr:unnamed protein product [Diabrotica balteata]